MTEVKYNDDALTILQEECAELIVAISKIKRFGTDPHSRAAFEQEMADVLCMISYFMDKDELMKGRLFDGMSAKRDKLSIFAKSLTWNNENIFKTGFFR